MQGLGEKENPFIVTSPLQGSLTSVSIAVKKSHSACPRSLLLGSNKMLSHAKWKPPFLGELPTQLSFGSSPGKAGSTYSQQEASGAGTGSQLRKGQTRTFLDRDQGVGTAPVAHAVRLRFYYQWQRVRRHIVEKRTVNLSPKNPNSDHPPKTKSHTPQCFGEPGGVPLHPLR